MLLVREVALRELLSEELSSLLPELSEPPLREVEALLRLLEVLVVLLLVSELRLVEVLLRLVEVLLLSLLLVETPELRFELVLLTSLRLLLGVRLLSPDTTRLLPELRLLSSDTTRLLPELRLLSLSDTTRLLPELRVGAVVVVERPVERSVVVMVLLPRLEVMVLPLRLVGLFWTVT